MSTKLNITVTHGTRPLLQGMQRVWQCNLHHRLGLEFIVETGGDTQFNLTQVQEYLEISLLVLIWIENQEEDGSRNS